MQEGSIRDIKSEREKLKKQKKLTKMTKRIIIVSLVVLFIIIFKVAMNTPFFGRIASKWSTQDEPGHFPQMLDDMKKYEIFDVDGKVGVVTDTRIYVYDVNGKRIKNILHGLEEPNWDVGGSRIVYYGKGGSIIYVQDIYGKLEQHEVDGSVISAKISANGNLAVAYTRRRGTSRVKVFRKKSEIFDWKKTDERVMTLNFGNDGQTVLFDTVNVDSTGHLEITYYSYDLNKTAEDEVKWTDKNIIPYSMDNGLNRTTVISDKKIEQYNKEGKPIYTYDFGDNILAKYELGGKTGTLISYKDTISGEKNELVYLDSNLSEIYTLKSSSEIKDFCFKKNVIYLLIDDRVEWYNRRGEHVGGVNVPETSAKFVITGNYIYVLTSTSVEQVPLTISSSKGNSGENENPNYKPDIEVTFPDKPEVVPKENDNTEADIDDSNASE